MEELQEFLYRHRMRMLAAITVIFVLFVIITSILSKEGLAASLATIGTHVSAIAAVIVATQFLMAGFEKFERKAQEDRVLASLRQLANSMSASVPAEYSADAEMIFAKTIPMLEAATSTIAVTAHVYTRRAPAYWFDFLLSKLKESKAAGRAVDYLVKFFVDFATADEALIKNIEWRVQRQIDAGVNDLTKVEFIDATAVDACDFMVVDERHVAIRFCPNTSHQAANFGLTFFDAPELAKAVLRWHSNLPRGVDFETFKARVLAGRARPARKR